MNYEANAELLKKNNRIYSEFVIDLQSFLRVSNEVFNANAQDEELKAKCDYLRKLCDQIGSESADLKQIIPVQDGSDEITGTATRI